jgi:hypothetical protein
MGAKMTECCQGDGVPRKRITWAQEFLDIYGLIDENRSNVIDFASLTPEAQQEFADFHLKEIFRHLEDIRRGAAELAYIKKKYNITARGVYVSTWIEVGK